MNSILLNAFYSQIDLKAPDKTKEKTKRIIDWAEKRSTTEDQTAGEDDVYGGLDGWVKRNVLSSLRKDSMESFCWTDIGRLFHTLGAK